MSNFLVTALIVLCFLAGAIFGALLSISRTLGRILGALRNIDAGRAREGRGAEGRTPDPRPSGTPPGRAAPSA